MQDQELLKKDLLGEVWRVRKHDLTVVLRNAGAARWWLAWPARALLRREARALLALDGMNGVPELYSYNAHSLERSYLPGEALFVSRPKDASFFIAAAQLLRRLHRAGVAHNDLAKEANIVVRENGAPAFIDFQLAHCSRNRGRIFRIAAREDIRHLLKHKKTYRPDLLTVRECAILSSPSSISMAWMTLVKPIYLFVTRRLLGWADREGAADR